MNKQPSATFVSILVFLLAAVFSHFVVPAAFAGDDGRLQGKGINKHWRNDQLCTLTSKAALKACRNEALDDSWIAIGNCANLSESDARSECRQEAKVEYPEALELCDERLEARLAVCEDLGEDPYDPILSPADFVDPDGIDKNNINPYWPLLQGIQWVYEGETDEGLEVITVTVTDQIKEIEYPAESGQIFRCREVRDLVELEGVVIEDTKDWYAQDKAGNVWYFGEIALNFEDGEVVDVEGSWKAGVDSAKPGILMLIDPQAGDIYRQEFFLGDAEDMAFVKSRGTEAVAVPFGSFAADVLQTEEWTPIDPEAVEYKYYSPGTGMVLELNPESGERVELVEMTSP